jgi:division protein CdvB (Snf7/Vps24/ESCRT-III family)
MGILRTLHKPPLSQRIDRAIYLLNLQQAKLERISQDTEKISQETFDKCVKAQTEGDNVRASLYATECAQARKVAHTLLASRMAVEQMMLRLQTLKEFKNVVKEIVPVAKVAKSLRGKLTSLVPGVSLELRDVNDTLENMLIEAGEIAKGGEVGAPSHEADSILQQAAIIAEHKTKERFPPAPVYETEKEASGR